MSRFLTGLLAGTALLTGIGSANALTISGGTASVSSKLTDYTSFALGSLNKFDTTLGTLTQVTITVIYGFNSTITGFGDNAFEWRHSDGVRCSVLRKR